MSLSIFKNLDGSYTINDCYGGGRWEFNSKELLSFLEILDMFQRGVDIEHNIAIVEDEEKRSLLNEVYSFVIEQDIPLHVTFAGQALLKNFKNYSPGIISVPFTNMEVSRLCNYRCYWCFLDEKTDSLQKALTIDEMMTYIVEPMSKLGVIQWGITGGEPSLTLDKTLELAKGITKIVQELYGLQADIILFTNGSNLSEFASLYKESGITSVQVSMSSGNPELENKLRKPPAGIDSYHEVIKGIGTCKNLGLKVNLNSVISHDIGLGSNIDTIPELFDIAAKFEVDVLDLSLACPAGEAKKNNPTFTNDEYIRILHYLSLNKEKLSPNTYYSHPCENLEEHREICCGTGMIEFYIDFRGFAYPCNNLSDPLLKCSKQRVNEMPIDDIWFKSSLLAKLRDYDSFYVSNECGICEYRGFCVGSCIAKIWHQFGSFSLNDKPDYCYKNQFEKGGYIHESN